MFQKVITFWNQSEGKRILRAGLMLLAVLFCVCTMLEHLNGKASNVEAAAGGKSGEIKLGPEGKKADEEAAQETGTGTVQSLTEDEVHLQEIVAIEAAILPGQYPVMGESSIQVQQMVEFFNTKGEIYPTEVLGAGGASDIETFCQIYYDEAVQEGVRPEVAFAQTMKETGWLQYGGDASISQYNFAGLGTTGGGVPGNSYPDVRTGVRAQIQHLKAYATDQSLTQECVDDRYTYVTKGCAPFVEWLGQNENPEGYGWATGLNYGYDIVDMIHTMRSF